MARNLYLKDARVDGVGADDAAELVRVDDQAGPIRAVHEQGPE